MRTRFRRGLRSHRRNAPDACEAFKFLRGLKASVLVDMIPRNRRPPILSLLDKLPNNVCLRHDRAARLPHWSFKGYLYALADVLKALLAMFAVTELTITLQDQYWFWGWLRKQRKQTAITNQCGHLLVSQCTSKTCAYIHMDIGCVSC